MKKLLCMSVAVMTITMALSISIVAACNCLDKEKQTDQDYSSKTTQCGTLTCTISQNYIDATYSCNKPAQGSNCVDYFQPQHMFWDGGCDGEGGCKPLKEKYWFDESALSWSC